MQYYLTCNKETCVTKGTAVKKIIVASLFVFSSLAIANQVYYPKRAAGLMIGGTVTVTYDINRSGRTENVKVVDAKPPRIFDSGVIRDIQSWKFEPGEPRAGQRITITFDPTDRK
jgi:TonB family protein